MKFQPGISVGQGRLVELGEIALGRVGVGGERRCPSAERRADP